jgi:hypothetical protein
MSYVSDGNVDVTAQDEFREKGYVVISGAFDSALVPSLRNELVRVHEDFPSLKAQHPLMHKLGEWSIRSPQAASVTLRDFVFSDHFAGPCKALVGNDVDLYWCATAAKPKEKGKGFPWHQDAGYGGGPDEYITFWSAFDEVDVENGCLWAVPGSHLKGIQEHEFRKSDETDYGGPFIKRPYDPGVTRVSIPLSPGDIVCMHSKLIHASFQNTSSRERRGLITAFVRSGENQILQTVGTPEVTVPFIRSGRRLDF